ncbi:MAG: hypothetical protein WCK00_07645 [Deltaproteobacteria bacterium]
MKKFLVVLLSLGLIVAFGMTASAADVKFSGQYYLTGQYENNRTLSGADSVPSLANMWQRTRIQTAFGIADGLTFTTRFDALERQWGNISNSSTSNLDRSNSRTAGTVSTVTVPGATAGTYTSTSTVTAGALQENIEFEQAYVGFKTAIGMFNVGYQAAGEWGTGFGDEPNSRPRLKLDSPIGPVIITAIFEKQLESAASLFRSDADGDKYMLAATYQFKGGAAGLLYVNTNMANTRPGTTGYRTTLHTLDPYIKATFGPVYLEGELIYTTGKWAAFDNGTTVTGPDVSAGGLGAYGLVKASFGPGYFGASAGYSSGNDYSNADKNGIGPKSSTSWSPGIIFGDANYRTWNQGANGGNIGNANGVQYDMLAKQNLLAYNVFGGYNPTPKLNIDMQFWMLQADTAKLSATTEAVSKKYGMELDLTATYKIYDNLSYMVGAGYFQTGDYFKGTNSANTVGNDYVLLNKLTLNF